LIIILLTNGGRGLELTDVVLYVIHHGILENMRHEEVPTNDNATASAAMTSERDHGECQTNGTSKQPTSSGSTTAIIRSL
jgi:hypothetical protein